MNELNLMANPNLWLNLVSYYEEPLWDSSVGRTRSNVQPSSIKERLQIIVDCKKKLKKLYIDRMNVNRGGEAYGVEFSKSGRAKCKKCYQTIPYKVVRGYIDSSDEELGYETHGCYHMDCFVQLLIECKVMEEEVSYSSSQHKELISKLYKPIYSERREKVLSKCETRVCDHCTILLNGSYYTCCTDLSTPIDSCYSCFNSRNPRDSNFSYVPKGKFPQHCKLCKKEISNVLFNCHNCNISFCRACLKDGSWLEHKNHVINIVGLSNEEDIQYLSMDFSSSTGDGVKPLTSWLKQITAIMKNDVSSMKPLQSNNAASSSGSMSHSLSAQQLKSSVQLHEVPIEKKRSFGLSSSSGTEEEKANPKKKKLDQQLEKPNELLPSNPTVPSFADDTSSKKNVQESTTNNKVKETIQEVILESGDSDKISLLDRIVGFKLISEKQFYLIKWGGFPSSFNTWEPIESVSPELIEDFDLKIKQQQTTKTSR